MVGKIMKEYGSWIIGNVRIEDFPFGDPSSCRLAVISKKCPIFRPYFSPAIFLPNGTHFELQLACVRAGRPKITRKSGPHASALRLKIFKVSAIDFSACMREEIALTHYRRLYA